MDKKNPLSTHLHCEFQLVRMTLEIALIKAKSARFPEDDI